MLKLRGHLHAGGRFFVSDTEQRGTTPFVLRRARPLASVQDAYLGRGGARGALLHATLLLSRFQISW